MILDSSAVVAIFFQEPGFEALMQKLTAADALGMGAPTLVECGIVLSARLDQDARGLLARFIEEVNISIVPFSAAHYGVALAAWRKYGKGRHSAALNLGDCLAYAVAKMADMPLLCVGDDFPQTDLEIA